MSSTEDVFVMENITEEANTTVEFLNNTTRPALSQSQKLIGFWVVVGLIIFVYVVLVVTAMASLCYRIRVLKESAADIFGFHCKKNEELHTARELVPGENLNLPASAATTNNKGANTTTTNQKPCNPSIV